MVTDLLLPKKGIETLELPSYVKLDMAFGLGTGTTLFDKSRYRSHGTISGANWATGAHGYALDFIGATPSYVEIPATHTQLNFTSEDFSIIIRARFDSVAAEQYLFSRGEVNTDGWGIDYFAWAGVALRTFQSGASQHSYSPGGELLAATWYTLGFSRDGAAVKVYINGIDKTEFGGTHINPVTCSRSVKIGIYDNKSSAPFDGKIEFLRIIGGVALSASEHLAFHNALA